MAIDRYVLHRAGSPLAQTADASVTSLVHSFILELSFRPFESGILLPDNRYHQSVRPGRNKDLFSLLAGHSYMQGAKHSSGLILKGSLSQDLESIERKEAERKG